jgi:hypothetical protein
MSNGKLIVCIAACMISTGCIFNKKTGGSASTATVDQEQHAKVLLKLSGPADWEEGRQRVAAELMRLPYVIDACVSNKFYGSVFVHLSPNSTYNIKDLQKACKLAGYDIIRAAEISW